ncbi:AP2 domain-containing protein [Streptococcus suis]
MDNRKSVEIGVVYNFLETLSFEGKNRHGRKLYKFKCLLCEVEKIMEGMAVKNGYSKSCGCLSILRSKERATKHNMSGTKAHRAWKGMKQRCYNPNYYKFDRYGGRGIVVCDEWIDSFEQFYKDMGEPPTSKHQLDRIDNDGNYCAKNCRWVLPNENSNNRKAYKNATGYTGVIENTSKKGRYSSVFYVNRKHVQVGTFDSPEETYKARVEAIKKYNKENNTNLKYVEFEDFKPMI